MRLPIVFLLLGLVTLIALTGCATMPATPCGKAAWARQAAVETIKAIDAACPLAHVQEAP